MHTTLQLAMLLATARAEIRSLRDDVESLPAEAAAPFLHALEWLASKSSQLEHQVEIRLRSH